MRRYVWSRNLKNEEAMNRVGSQRHRKKREGEINMSQRLRWSRGSVLAFGIQVRGFTPGRNRRIFRAKEFLSTPSFGGEVQPSVSCRNFTACKRSLNVTCKSAFRQNSQTFPQFHLPPLGALAWWHAWRRLVAKVGTSNSDRTVSLRLQCVVKKHRRGNYVPVREGVVMWLTKWRGLVSFPPRPSVPLTGQVILQKRCLVCRKLNHGSSVVQPISYWLHSMS